ncbi:MAG: DUF3786 domain-containing protein [Desulfobacteraceae bacterium]|nr:DUF3786 domain-containing protein [Desulfobacteraceae bacterium]
MNPFDILRLTPKSNCGRCGYPACLAFAAAVARDGEDPGRCPFLDRGRLAIGKPSPRTGGEEAQELALVAHLREKVGPLDFATLAGPLGAAWQQESPDILTFPYLGRQTTVGKTAILIEGREPDDHRDQILLYNYVHGGGGRPPAGDWVGMESLPNSISKRRTLAVYCEERLARLFSGRPPDLLLMAARPLDPRRGGSGSAALDLVFPVLPIVPLEVLFWEAAPEDGFPAKVKVLFDRHVLDFLDLESLVFVAERLADRMGELVPPEKDSPLRAIG